MKETLKPICFKKYLALLYAPINLRDAKSPTLITISGIESHHYYTSVQSFGYEFPSIVCSVIILFKTHFHLP